MKTNSDPAAGGDPAYLVLISIANLPTAPSKQGKAYYN
jgi:hypothetical protein